MPSVTDKYVKGRGTPRSPSVRRSPSASVKRRRELAEVRAHAESGGTVVTKPSHKRPMTTAEMLRKRAMWLYMVVALVIFFFLFLVYRDHNRDVNTWARVPSLLSNSLFVGLVVLAALLLSAWATSVVSQHSGIVSLTAGVGVLYLIIGALLIAMTWLTYRQHSYVAAFAIAVLALVLAAAHFFAVWSVHRHAAYADLPLIVILVASVYYLSYMADGSTECGSKCKPVRETPYN